MSAVPNPYTQKTSTARGLCGTGILDTPNPFIPTSTEDRLARPLIDQRSPTSSVASEASEKSFSRSYRSSVRRTTSIPGRPHCSRIVHCPGDERHCSWPEAQGRCRTSCGSADALRCDRWLCCERGASLMILQGSNLRASR